MSIYVFEPQIKDKSPWWKQKEAYLYGMILIAILCASIIVMISFYYSYNWIIRNTNWRQWGH